MNESALDQLCSLYGIDPEYIDIWGNHHRVSVDTKLALLAAMGVDAGDDARMHAAIMERLESSWRRCLEPVKVVVQSCSPPVIELTLPRSLSAGTLHWDLVLENGRRFSGDMAPADLQMLREQDMGGIVVRVYAFTLPCTPGLGYHRFSIRSASGVPVHGDTLRLIVTPETCFQPPVLAGSYRSWGLAVQLYAQRSRHNWGMGDFTDLKSLVEQCTALGGGIIGLNPLHALFLLNPEHASPYSPSSRLFLNVLYLDVEAIPEYAECEEARELVAAPGFQSRLARLREDGQVDYAGVAALKMQLFELLYRHFRNLHLTRESPASREFRLFQAERGDALYRHTLHEVLQEHFYRQDPALWDWRLWPPAYRDPASGEVAEFAAGHQERMEFFQYLQWRADCQLADAAGRADERDLAIGIYHDIAVGVDHAGAESWAYQDLYTRDAGIGAPPDEFFLGGQNWGLPPMIPHKLRESGYAIFIAMLRANMRHARAVRLDHVMGLMRLFWIPAGAGATSGAYVHYHFEELLGILALESQRHRCLVIGEDLGTVPDAVRERLAPRGVLSYRLLYFEKNGHGEFKPPADYPALSVVSVTSHDLATLTGYWRARDIHERAVLDLYPSPQLHDQHVAARARERARLLAALEREGLLPDDLKDMDPSNLPEMTPELACAIERYLARAPSKLLLVQLEDVLGQVDQVNLPATADQRPNWRYKVPRDIESIGRDTVLQCVVGTLGRERNPLRDL